MSAVSSGSGIGASVRRIEDLRLITGKGSFSDDVNLPDQVYAIFVRSQHAHARIRSIDIAAAKAMPNVLTVLTAEEMFADGLQPVPHQPNILPPGDAQFMNRDGSPGFSGNQYPLAADKVRHVGEAVAVVIARSLNAAKDAAEAVDIDYEILPSVTATATAVDVAAPCIWDEIESNVCLDAEGGNAADTERAFAKAKHIVRIDTWAQRVTGVTLEPRAAVCSFDSTNNQYTLFAGSGGAVRLKSDMAIILNVPESTVRVVMEDVGGNFGTRGMIYPEFAIIGWASRRVGYPVKWTCERHEAFASDYQGRDLSVTAELALDAEGNFLAMRGSNISNAGAHTASFAPLKKGMAIMSSIYRMPTAYFRGRAVVTNTPSTRAYRSAGRPEVMYVMERLIDIAARECGFDRIELRRRNLLTQAELPYTNPFSMTYDSGAYHKVMDAAMELADWSDFDQRRVEAAARGKYRGIGIANYVDTSTGVPRERAEITVHPGGWVDVVIGVTENGQGHETSFGQLVTEWLGVALEHIRLLDGDTDVVKVGGGAHGGRGMRMASVVIWNSCKHIIEKGKRLAARLFECDPSSIVFESGRFSYGNDVGRSAGLFEIAAAAQTLKDLPEDLRGPLTAFSDELHKVASFPYGCHVCEVEIDPELGSVQIVGYAAVDDVGRAINPLLIDGQIHGGIAQGAGQALLEQCFYDADTGQLLSGSLMDYAMPRADNLPFFKTEISEVPATTHPLGIRPAGESGITPALGVVINAVVDALAQHGVKHIEMPATPERIWRAINRMQPYAAGVPKNR